MATTFLACNKDDEIPLWYHLVAYNLCTNASFCVHLNTRHSIIVICKWFMLHIINKHNLLNLQKCSSRGPRKKVKWKSGWRRLTTDCYPSWLTQQTFFWIYGWRQQRGLMLGLTSVVFYFYSQMIWNIAVVWWQYILAQDVIVFSLTFFDIMYAYCT